MRVVDNGGDFINHHLWLFGCGYADSIQVRRSCMVRHVVFPLDKSLLRYIDSLGLDKFCEIADKYADLGKLYHPTEKMREMAKKGQKYFG